MRQGKRFAIRKECKQLIPWSLESILVEKHGKKSRGCEYLRYQGYHRSGAVPSEKGDQEIWISAAWINAVRLPDKP